MIHIQTVELGSSQSSITFSSIPQDYDDLMFVISARATGNVTNLNLLFNGSGANFTTLQLFGNGTSASSNSGNNAGFAYGMINDSTATADTFGNSSIYIPNYTQAINKSFSQDGVSENNATQAYQTISAGLWSNTSAITSVEFVPSASHNFVTGSTISLYGITAGGDGTVTTA